MDEIEQYYCKIEEKYKKYCAYFDHKIIEDIPNKIFVDKDFASLREYCVFRMGFSVVTRNNCRILAQIINHENVLEIMCGLGSYSATLASLGVNIIPTDNMSWMDYETSKYKNWKRNSWCTAIECLDAVQAIKKYGKNVGYILMSWPPQHENFALDALLTMRKVNPACRMIYIGERKGGCTANDEFFDEAIDVSDEYLEVRELRESYHAWMNNDYHDLQFIMR